MRYDVSLTIDVPSDLTQDEVELSIRGCIDGFWAPTNWDLENINIGPSAPT
jgi:hypothetical protein